MAKISRDMWLGIFSSLFGIVLYIYTVMQPWARSTHSELMGPSLLPKLLALIFVGSGLLQMFIAFRRLKNETNKGNTLAISELLIIVILCAIYVIVLPWLGYVLPSLCLVLILMYWWGETSIPKILLISAISSVGTFYIGKQILAIALPTGALWSMLFGW